jgi:cupin 2 domain-containing protein
VPNLYARETGALDAELIETGTRCGLERIVSLGRATPHASRTTKREPMGRPPHRLAGIRFEDESTPRVLGPGDRLLIAAHRRHRVEWTVSE